MSLVLTAERKISDNLWKVTFTIPSPDPASADAQLIRKFGAPVVEFGGTFDPSNPLPSFELPTRPVAIPSGTPVTITFDSAHPPFDEDTSDLCMFYISTVQQRIIDAVTELRTKPDNFTGVTTITI